MTIRTARYAGTAALIALSLAAAGCKKSDTAAQERTSDAPQNATDSTKAAVADKTAVAEDSAAAVVGPLSAATAGSLSASAFVDNAAQSDMYEIQAAKLAEKRSKSPAIRKFAAMMIQAHTKSTDELKSIVSAGGAGDAKLPTGLDNRRQGLIDNLVSASDSDFDARYVDQQQAAHREAEILMKGYSTAGSNAQLKTFAAKMSPIVASHTKMAEQLDRGNADHDKPGSNSNTAG
jgi:putative membrane protein